MELTAMRTPLSAQITQLPANIFSNKLTHSVPNNMPRNPLLCFLFGFQMFE